MVTPGTPVDPVLSDPQKEINAILAADPQAWQRWKTYDADFSKAQQLGKEPWLVAVNVWGWSAYFCMLNELLNPMFGQPAYYIYPTPTKLAQEVASS